MSWKRALLPFALASSTCLLPDQSDASLYCTKPTPPYCIDAYGTFDSEWSFRSCRNEVEGYVEEVNRYIRCVLDEADQEARTATTEADDTIDRFNCKAEGNTYCP